LPLVQRVHGLLLQSSRLPLPPPNTSRPKEKVGANPPDETPCLRASDGLYGKGFPVATCAACATHKELSARRRTTCLTKMSDVTYHPPRVASRQTPHIATGRSKFAAVYEKRSIGGWVLPAAAPEGRGFVAADLSSNALYRSALSRA
jgi:hypothetical protein